MEQRILNEEQMREYVEKEVRSALMNENIDEGFLGDIWSKITQLFGGLRGENGLNGNLLQSVGNYVKQNMSLEEVLGFVIRLFGVNAVLNLICQILGFEISSPIGHIIKLGIAAVGATVIANLGTGSTPTTPTAPAADGAE